MGAGNSGGGGGAIKERLQEPSTYAGLAVLGTLFGMRELEELTAPEIAAAIAAAVAILLPENHRGFGLTLSASVSAGLERRQNEDRRRTVRRAGDRRASKA